MREIEIKARMHDKTALLVALQQQNVTVSDPVTQHDRVFGLPGADDDLENHPWLRIRAETKGSVTKQIFTLKKSVTNQLDSIEHETEIVDEAELEKIIGQLGFEPYSDVTKTRQKAKIGDIELCIDEVEQLGSFVEAEKLTSDDADYEKAVDELWGVFERFGIMRDAEVNEGYDVMMKALKKP